MAGDEDGLSDGGFTALKIGAFGAPRIDEDEGAREASSPDDADAAPPATEDRPLGKDIEPGAPERPFPQALAPSDDGERAQAASRRTPEPAAASKAAPVKDHRSGHRDRLRARLREAGPGAVAEYELMEMILFRAIPRRDVKALAKTLVADFDGLAGVINAPEARLREIKGVGDAVISELRLMAAVSRAVLRERIETRPVLSSWEAVLDYARAHIAFSNVEHFHVLFLDKKNRLIRDEIQQTGTVDHTPVYPREVVRRAIELDATALILVHNHPSGDVTPSKADVAVTKTVVEVAKPLGIRVHDHVIVGRNGHASLKGLGLM